MSEIEISEYVEGRTVTEYTPKGLELALERDENNHLEEIAQLVRALESEDTSQVGDISVKVFEEEGRDKYTLSFKYDRMVPIVVNQQINDCKYRIGEIGMGHVNLTYTQNF